MPDAPIISPRVRSIVYIACLAIDVLAFVGFGLAALFDFMPEAKATAAGAIIVAGVNMVSVGLSVGYRPTRDAASQSRF